MSENRLKCQIDGCSEGIHIALSLEILSMNLNKKLVAPDGDERELCLCNIHLTKYMFDNKIPFTYIGDFLTVEMVNELHRLQKEKYNHDGICLAPPSKINLE